MANLKINNLSKSFNHANVINSISFKVSEGEFCILLGPSGCGKTTVLRLIAGLEQQDSGEIFIGDNEVSNLTPKERDIAMVFQSYALYPHMNVYENMSFSLKIQKRPKDEIENKVKETTALLELDNFLDRKPKELSGGQRQRVAIGRAIVRNPKLFLFDEPLSNLDAKLRNSMRVEIAGLHRKLKATTVYVTHDQVEAMTLGEKIVLLDQGKIQQIGTPDEMYHKPANIFVATFIGTPQINLLEGKLTSDQSGYTFISGSLNIPLGQRDELTNYTDQNITAGIRPEALTATDGPVRGSVELVEHLGPETLVYFKSGDTRLIAKAPSDFKANQGSTISLNPNSKGIHFFYNGERIG
jgi:ABC-type sugar transport system ATPase subunit